MQLRYSLFNISLQYIFLFRADLIDDLEIMEWVKYYNVKNYTCPGRQWLKGVSIIVSFDLLVKF